MLSVGNDTQKKFLLELENIVPEISDIVNDSVMYWGSDIPASIVFSELGTAISEIYKNNCNIDIKNVLCLVEFYTENEDIETVNCIYTGFLESFSNAFIKNPKEYSYIKEIMGRNSKNYVREIDKFYGVGRI